MGTVLNDDCGANNEVDHQLRRGSKDLLTLPIFCHLYLYIPHQSHTRTSSGLAEYCGTSRPSFGDTFRYQDRHKSYPFAQRPTPHCRHNGRAIDRI
jgi:hypothetical protein